VAGGKGGVAPMASVVERERVTAVGTSRGRSVLRRSGSVLLWLVVVVLVLAVAGATYQVIATRRDQSAFPPPGEMKAARGLELHINCVGRGSPTVILEAALGNMSASWIWVQQKIAEATRVCTYDAQVWAGASPDPSPGMRSRSLANSTPCLLAQT
jgi:hypothetical protein